MVVIATTSWDDGHPEDLQVAKLLKKYRVKGTFYIPLKNPENEVIDENDIKKLSENFEIGSHTVSHRVLTSLSLNEMKKEIMESKITLESITEKKIHMFCYPRGKYNTTVVNFVKEAGYIGARTTEQYTTGIPKNLFTIGTTIHIYPYSSRKFFGNILKHLNLTALKYIRCLNFSLVEMTRCLFDFVHNQGGIFHLWGHSWEIEKFGLWEELEEILEYISNKTNVIYVSNGELVDLIKTSDKLKM